MSAQTYTTDQKLVFIAKAIGAECFNLETDWLYCDYEEDNEEETKLIAERVRKALCDETEKALKIVTDCVGNDVFDEDLTEQLFEELSPLTEEGIELDEDKYPMYPLEE